MTLQLTAYLDEAALKLFFCKLTVVWTISDTAKKLGFLKKSILKEPATMSVGKYNVRLFDVA